jgi:hypothetical protein
MSHMQSQSRGLPRRAPVLRRYVDLALVQSDLCRR